MQQDEVAAACDALIYRGLLCGDLIEAHDLRGSARLECWPCEDWQSLVPSSAERRS